jgi:ribosomal silencing factor RsfS
MPKDLRINCDYFIITKTSRKKELTEIAKDNTTDISHEEFLKIYRDATNEPYSFLVIDLKTQDPKMKYRKDFTIALTDSN